MELIKPFQHGDQPLDDRGKENMGTDILNGHVQEISSSKDAMTRCHILDRIHSSDNNLYQHLDSSFLMLMS